jgi:hypothetical protein
MLKKLRSEFKKLSDDRGKGRCSFSMADILLTAFLAVVRGRSGWLGVSAFAADNLASLQRLMPGLDGAPSADTFARVVGRVRQRKFCQLVANAGRALLRSLLGRRPGRRSPSAPRTRWPSTGRP